MNKKLQKTQRQKRIRKKIRGTSDHPRLTVFRSNKHIYAQIIDDAKKVTLVSMHEKGADSKVTGSIEKAKAVGVALAKAATAKKIKTVVFDKGSYAYHGRVKALAEGAREGGLKF
jgi:large subunit ribosomal protein L18